ncbi:MAG: DUF2784 domain-containing protein [Deltaproteobacteria bacterium]
MLYRLLADFTIAFHFLFMLFVVFGGLLLFWRKFAIWLHLPAAGWGVFIELSGRICPLTPLENHFRNLAGMHGYQSGFIEHYLLQIVYPAGLTRNIQLLLATGVLFVNLLIYGAWLYLQRRIRRHKDRRNHLRRSA